VVDVAALGLSVAGGCGTGLGAGAEQVLELAARDVTLLGVPVVAGVPGNGLEGDAETTHEIR
jgi:hypothetical protein